MAEVIPTERELEALKVLWARGRATVREVYQELSPREGELAYTTVLSLLQTMERKGLVGHEPAGKGYAYFARCGATACSAGWPGASWSASSTARWANTSRGRSSRRSRASLSWRSWSG